jgi:hypothetical protein
MINYDGPKAAFAIKNHPKQALADIRHLTAAVTRLTEERAVLHQRVADIAETINEGWRTHVEDLNRAHAVAHAATRQRITDIERELAECRARMP